MAGNVVAKADARGNLYPRKPDGQNHLKIDGIVAALMAEAVAQVIPEAVQEPFIDTW
jgi:phage terminase large subunit-like protein